MKVKLINYTKDGMHLIASMAKATRQNELDMKWLEDKTYKKIKLTFHSDEAFVRQLIKIGHLGVLEHINFTFHISEVSRILSHQLVRHRLASYLQMSNRHVKPEHNHYVIPDTIDNLDKRVMYQGIVDYAYVGYKSLIEKGVPIEDARYVLPPAFFTHISMTMNTRTLKHFLELRLDKSAHGEIRELANQIFILAYNKYPILFEDLKDKFDKNHPIRLAVEHSKTMKGLAGK